MLMGWEYTLPYTSTSSDWNNLGRVDPNDVTPMLGLIVLVPNQQFESNFPIDPLVILVALMNNQKPDIDRKGMEKVWFHVVFLF